MNEASLNKLLSDAAAIEAEGAKDARALGFMTRALVQTTMPHKRVEEPFFIRRNGKVTLSMLAPPQIGLPYGSIPRLLMAWLTTEVVRVKNRNLMLGDSLTSFMRELDLVPTGGRWGTITRLRDQTRRLFSTAISCQYDDASGPEGCVAAGGMMAVADKYVLWWNPKSPDQKELFQSTVRLSESFYEELISHPIPIDMRALKALKRSPFALDIYCWLTYRLSYLTVQTLIPWPLLQAQFGADYATDEQGMRNFKKNFSDQLSKVLVIYSQAKVKTDNKGLILTASRPHISRR